MALRNWIIASALLSILGGCVSQVQLANDKGQTAQCNAAGLGLVTAVVAASEQKDCIERYQSQGYRQVPLPTASASAATPTATGKAQANECNTYGPGIVSWMVAASVQQTCVGNQAAQAPASAGEAPAR
jgi:hypothetical protein